jgi:hypothetical protein
MPEAQQDTLSATDIRRILTEKYPPTTPREQVYVSVVLALLETVEANEEQTQRAIRALGAALGKVAVAAGVDLRAVLTGQPPVAAPAAAPSVAAEPPASNDQTPFPAGVAASAPPGTTQRVAVQSAPEEAPVPNVQSGPPVNARPNLKPTPNGTPKAAS